MQWFIALNAPDPEERVNSMVYFKTPILIAGLIFLTGCASLNETQAPLLEAEPAVGSVLASTPRTLRLYFEQLPDVPRSSVTLRGPAGDLNLRGLHTMGANDLMMEIYDNVPDGIYTVLWSTYFGADLTPYSGSYTFTVDAD